MDYSPNSVDLNKTTFHKLEINEQMFETGNVKQYEYHGNVDVDIWFKPNPTDDENLNRTLSQSPLKYTKTLFQTHDKRPDCLNDVVTPQDEKEDTVDAAIQDYIDMNMKNSAALLNFVSGIFDLDIARYVLEDAYNSKSMILNNGKVVQLEFDYRKPKVKSLAISYENDVTHYVELPKEVTNYDAMAVVPDMTLVELYTNFEDWLEEDYKGTIEIANAVFKIDLETLKGAEIKA